jgi:hypothetical protein
VEGEELRAAALKRRSRGQQHVDQQRRREPAAEPVFGAVLHQEPHHPGDEVEHRQLVEHLQLESERRVEGDAPKPHQHQQSEGHPHLPGKGLP